MKSDPIDLQFRGPMLARQASALDGYHDRVEDTAGRPVGEVLWPMLAQARNARVRWHGQDGRGQGEVRIICGTRDCRVSFEYLDRGWVNDVRYRLLDGAITLAVAELRFTPGKISRGELRLLEPLTARLRPDGGWLRRRYLLQAEDGRELGRVEDRAWLMSVREMTLSLPATLEAPVQLFVFFLACQLLQTQV